MMTSPTANSMSNPQETADCNMALREVVYELRTPLTSIRGVLGLLQNDAFGNLPPEAKHLLTIAINNTDRLMRLTQAIEQEAKPSINFLSGHDMARLRLETSLQTALEKREFCIYYQPIQLLESNKLVGFEALLRWKHPTLGMIAPDEFIPLAEATGLIIPLGEWVLREACYQLRSWQQQFPDHGLLTVSVNLSSKQLACPTLATQIQGILEETGLNSSSLKLEITESAMMEDPVVATVLLRQLQTMGIQIYIDDFGTGYSSLSRLHELPINVLKIDRSFINQLGLELTNQQIIRSILSLAWHLGIDVIAEGIETVDQAYQLRSLGCMLGQGYLFSKPVDSASATALLAL